MAPPASCTRPATARAQSVPTVKLGTKWPSMTSTWNVRAPAASRASSCSPRRSMSADITDGSTVGTAGSGALTRPSSAR